MTEAGEKSLLPAGLQDILPPQAAHEAAVVEALVSCFSAYGYDRIKLPLMEFESTLLSGAGAAVAGETFRLMDPLSQRMMALRADMTPQVARIAGSRMKNAPRPLRLCYGGQVLRTRGSQLRPERQIGQAGAELIGAPEVRADAEIILLAAEALNAAGVAHLSIDLNLPPLVGLLCRATGLEADRSGALGQALEQKDATATAAAAGEAGETFVGLLRATGPIERALPALTALALPDEAGAEIERLAQVVGLIRASMPELMLTVDPVEHRGFEYHTGISFTLFARQGRGELGRGGRYASGYADGDQEASTGFTLYMDSVLRALPAPDRGARLFVAADVPPATAKQLRADGWTTLAALDPSADPLSESRRLGCSHIWRDGEIHKL